MRKLLVYIKEYRLQCILGPLFKFCEASMELLVPLVMASIIDNGIGNGDKSHIVKMAVVLAIFSAAGLLFAITAQYFSAKAAVGFVKKVRHAVFEHINKLSYSQIDTIGSDTLITRLTSDMDTIQNGVNLTLRLLLRSPFVVFGAAIMAFTVDAKSAMTFVVVIPLLSIVIFSIMLVGIKYNKKVRAGLDKILGKTRENLSGVRVLRAFGKENEQIDEFVEENNNLTKIQEFTGKISVLMNPLTYIIINVGVAVLIYIGAIRVNGGSITQGQVVAQYNYMSQILIELVKLAGFIITLTKAVACGDRVQSVLDIVPDDNDTKENTTTSDKYISFDNVSFTYDGAGETSLEDISFTVNKGETIGIIGSTGSGKTTLVNLLPRLYRATKGTVYVDGKNVETYDADELRKKIAVVPQKAVLFKGTVRENMLYGNENATDDDIIQALEIAQAKDFVFEKDGLDARVSQGGKNFSGGQRQRLTVARAVVRKPEILILDDSSSALDYSTDAAMRNAISTSLKDSVIFIVSQRTVSIMNADKIIVLDDGRAVGVGTHDELVDKCDIYREIHLSQFGGEADNE